MTDYEKLKEIYNEIDSLLLKRVDTSSPDFMAWCTKTEDFLEAKYGAESRRFKRFESINFIPMILFGNELHSEYIEACANGLIEAKSIFEPYLKEMEQDMNNIPNLMDMKQNNKTLDLSKVFIVHGHDGEMREAIARIIENQGIHPIILSDEVNAGATIIEKIEKHSNVGAAICIFSPDDLGRSKKEATEHNRARQNVVLETGYFMGKLGRERVIILSNGDLEFPSDLQGIVYTGSEWKFKLLKELRKIGYEVDLNKL